MKIRFCENNEGSGVIFKRLRVDSPASDIKRKKCLKNCGVCNSSLLVWLTEYLCGEEPERSFIVRLWNSLKQDERFLPDADKKAIFCWS